MSNPVVEGAVKLNLSPLPQATPDGGGRSERARPGDNSQSDRSVQRICFEEYLEAWLKLATTGTGMSMKNLTLEKLIKYQEAFAMHYGSHNKPSEMTHFHNFTEGSLYKQPDKLKKTCTKKDRKLERLSRMKSIYLLYRTPGQQESEWRELPASRGCRADRDTQEGWETEVDTLVAWTHTLSVEEMEGE